MELVGTKSKRDSIADWMRQRLLSRELAVGDRLLPSEDLAAQCKVNKRTMAAALNMLVEEGFLERTRRRGTIVVSTTGAESPTSSAVGLVVMSEGDFYGRVVRKVIKTLGEGSLYPVALQTGLVNNADELRRFLGRMAAEPRPPFGFIVDGGTKVPFDYIRDDPNLSRNVVYIIKYHHPEITPSYARSVLLDFRAAGRAAARHLISQGRTNLACLAIAEPTYGGPWSSAQVQCMEGFGDACREAGASFDEDFFWLLFNGAPFEESVRARFGSSRRPTGFFCYQDALIRFRVLPVLRALGLDRPEIDFVGFYNTPHAVLENFSSLATDEWNLATKAVDLLTGRSDERHVMLAPELVVRAPALA